MKVLKPASVCLGICILSRQNAAVIIATGKSRGSFTIILPFRGF